LNPATQGSSLTEGKRTKRSKKGENGDANSTMNSTQNGDADSGGDETINSSKNGGGNLDEEDDDGWTIDVSEEAIRARMEDLTDGAKNMTLNEDAEKTEKERMDIFYEIVKKRRDANDLESVQVTMKCEFAKENF
jgi:translation initiation factor 5